MAQSPGIARVCSDHSLRYDRVARLARGREVCWNFYSLLEAQPTFSCTWMNGELWREKLHRLGEMYEFLNTFSIKVGGEGGGA